MIQDVGKLVFAIIVVAALTLMIVTESVSEGVGMGLLGAVVSYVLTNGKLVVQGRVTSPMLAPRVEPGQVATPEGRRDVVAVPVAELPPPDVIDDGPPHWPDDWPAGRRPNGGVR